MTPRMFKPEEVEFSLTVRVDDIPLRGNVMASGDEDADRQAEQHVREELERGNVWAWCRVLVTARWAGFEGVDSLGGCSYESEQDFLEDQYFVDMLAGSMTHMFDEIHRAGWAFEATFEAKSQAMEKAHNEISVHYE